MTSSFNLRIAEDVYKKITEEIFMLQDETKFLSREMDTLEDTWVESTPIMGCFMTTLDVVNHILKEKQALRDECWKRIKECRSPGGDWG
jgi:hypothetical protein